MDNDIADADMALDALQAALDRAQAQIAAGKAIDGTPARQRLRDSIARMEAAEKMDPVTAPRC